MDARCVLTMMLLFFVGAVSSMAGTHARALRRPKQHRHWHTANGAVPVHRALKTMDETLRIARQYARTPIAGKVQVDFKLQLAACHAMTIGADECELTLAKDFEQADEAGGWAM